MLGWPGALRDHPLRSVLDAVAHAIVVTDPDGRILLWSGGAEALFGWREEEVIGRPVVDVLMPPGTREHAQERISSGETAKTAQRDHVVLHREGSQLCIAVSTRPLYDDAEQIIGYVGVSEDVTQVRRLERAEADLTEHLQMALEAGGLGTWRWERSGNSVRWDARLEEIFGVESGGFGGSYESWIAAVHPDDRAETEQTLSRAIEEATDLAVRHRVIWPDGSTRWLAGVGRILLDDAGDVTGMIGYVDDITEQVEADEVRTQVTAVALAAAEAERRHRVRLEFLAAVNLALSDSREREHALHAVPPAALMGMAGWCALYVLPESDPDLENLDPDVAVATDDPTLEQFAHALEDELPHDAATLRGVSRVIRGGTTEVGCPGETDVMACEVGRSVLRVPLKKRGRTLGVLQLVQRQGGREYDDDDRAMAEVAAARIASSFANLRLIEHERHIATTLQRALLPAEIPAIPGLDIAVRYWASGEGTEVGGDFYDVFALDDHRWAAVVGDVCGKGPDAAALTSVTRHSIRMSAWHGDSPAEVLEWLNRALLPLGIDRFCTATYATIDATDEGICVTSTAGGHPLPIVSRADGSIEVIGEPGTILGVFPTIHSIEAITVLQPGDTVILYTDGITDVSPPHGFDEEEFADFVRGCLAEGGSADDIAERMLAAITKRLPIAQRADDIALLVLRAG